MPPDFPEAERALGTLMVSIYLGKAEDTTPGQPAILYHRGYDAAYVAWAKMGDNGTVDDDDDINHAISANTAKGLFDKWGSGIAQGLYQVQGDVVD
jgi:hypothetical protein